MARGTVQPAWAKSQKRRAPRIDRPGDPRLLGDKLCPPMALSRAMTESCDEGLGLARRRAAGGDGPRRIVVGDVAVAIGGAVALVGGAVAGPRAGGTRGAVVREHEVGDARRDLGAEARAVEHTIMTDVGLQPVRLEAVGKIAAEAVRGLGLADAGNVVVLPLDGHERDALDLARIDRDAAMGHLSAWQRVAHEHGLDRLQIERR